MSHKIIPNPIVPASKEEVTIPWLNQVFNPFNLHIKSFEWLGPANNDLGAMSTLERVKLHLDSGKSLSVIFKTLPPQDSIFYKITILHGFAIRELKVYTQLFPEWEEFLDSRNVPEKFRFRVPKCYYGAGTGDPADDTYQQILILEDLFSSGFELWPDGYGKSLKWTEAKPCIRLMALFHAVGLAYKEITGLKSYNSVMPFLVHDVDNLHDMLDMFVQGGFDVITQLVRNFGDTQILEKRDHPKPDEAVKLLPLPPQFFDHMQVLRKNAVYNLRFLNPAEDQMGTVVHHDVHVNNFMFLKKSMKGEHSAVFYDFQASMYSMPMKDLSFFLIQNCEESLLTTNFETTIQYYYDELHQALEAMGVPLHSYTLDRVKEEYKYIACLSTLHIIAGAAQSFVDAGGVTDTTKRRFYNVLVQMFNNGLLECRIDPNPRNI